MYNRLIVLCVLCGTSSVAVSQVRVEWDPLGEAVIRRTDAFADGEVGEGIHAIPDLVGYQIGRWAPDDPFVDPYTGNWSPVGGFLRLDFAILGFVNPPGTIGIDGAPYDPYLYGQNPFFGYVEFDADNDVSTGGEDGLPEQRYLGNVARFGGKTGDPRYADRVALSGLDLDGIIGTAPFVERSGEEWHIALLGDMISQIVELSGNGDAVFDPFESWLVRGPLLHRAHAFERFSGAGGDGVYEPTADLLFEYWPNANWTLVTLVFPLTNAAAALQLGEPVQPMDEDDSNHASIQEGLEDLIGSVQAIPLGHVLRSDPAFPLIAAWESGVPADDLDPDLWPVNILLGMAYEVQEPSGALFAWTDVMPEGLIGDFDGDGMVHMMDVTALDEFIIANDGNGPMDDDGTVDGIVRIANFGVNFSIFDLNYDGMVDQTDRGLIVIKGDLDFDYDVDFADLSIFLDVLLRPETFLPTEVDALVTRSDFNGDGLANGLDISGFGSRLIAD